MTDPGTFHYRLHSVHVLFGDGALARLPNAVDDVLAGPGLYVVSTPGRAALATTALDLLGDRVRGHFDRAALHVPTEVVAEALDGFRTADARSILALGGGSAIGLGKALARETGAPLGAVATTYSGSEMTDIWGTSDGRRKVTGRDRRVAPRLVVYDPELTHGMPAEVTGPSGVNAIAHAVEALYSETASPVSSLMAQDGLRRLAGALPRCVDRPTDGPARREALYGAHLAGRALDMTSMGLHHKLCHVLGGLLQLPHALTHAVVLPYVAAYNREAASAAMALVAACLGAADGPRGLWDLNRTLGIVRTLGDLGVTDADRDRVADAVVDAGVRNPAPVTREGVEGILTAAMAGRPPAP